MAGIKANSGEQSMGDGDTAADQAVSGYIADSQIILTTTPTGTNYTWGVALPSGSSSGLAALSSTTASAPVFTPDVAGTYTVVVDVDGTGYQLRIGVVGVTVAEFVQVVKFLPITDAQCPTPEAGSINWYCSSTQSNVVCQKDENGTVSTVDVTAV